LTSKANAYCSVGIVAIAVLARLALTICAIAPTCLVPIFALNVEAWSLRWAFLISTCLRAEGFQDTLLVKGGVSDVPCPEKCFGIGIVPLELVFHAICVWFSNAHADLAERNFREVSIFCVACFSLDAVGFSVLSFVQYAEEKPNVASPLVFRTSFHCSLTFHGGKDVVTGFFFAFTD